MLCCSICTAANHCTPWAWRGSKRAQQRLSPGREHRHFYGKDKVLSHNKAGDREKKLFKGLHRVWPHGSNALLHSRLSHLMISKLLVQFESSQDATVDTNVMPMLWQESRDAATLSNFSPRLTLRPAPNTAPAAHWFLRLELIFLVNGSLLW